MLDSLGFVLAIGCLWLAIGLFLCVVMGRRGHNSLGWLATGTVLGPLALVLAVDARRRGEELRPAPVQLAPAVPGRGPVDVLVGYDGSPEALAALDAVPNLLGRRLGRLALATVVPFDVAPEGEKMAVDALRVLGAARRRRSELEVLHGHPSTALRAYATQGNFKLIAIGSRGTGLSKAVLGSAARELSVGGNIPVLIVGPGPQQDRRSRAQPAEPGTLDPGPATSAPSHSPHEQIPHTP